MPQCKPKPRSHDGQKCRHDKHAMVQDKKRAYLTLAQSTSNNTPAMRDATLGVARSRENGSWESAVKRFMWEDARSTRSHDFVTILLFLVRSFASANPHLLTGSLSSVSAPPAKLESAKTPDEDFSSAERIVNP